MNKASSSIIKSAAALLMSVFLFGTTLISCEKTAPITPVTDVSAVQPDGNTDGTNSDSDASDFTEVKKPDGSIDSDADSIEGITIRSANELTRIGKNAKYPLDGDYVLIADIDLSGSAFTPIGGSASECGIVEGTNVFSGTFDGRGHTITGLKISVSSYERVHVGMFGSVGSPKSDDPAVIKNLILKDVSISANVNGSATYAALCGQVSGNAVIDNISIISGSIDVENSAGDVLGVGALIGQCRTQSYTGCTNETIHITNIFTNVEVNGDNNGNARYTSGLIGRIRGSNVGTLSNVLQLGSVTHEGGSGNAITGGDSSVVKSENVYYLAGCGDSYGNIGQAKSYESLCGGNIELDETYWHLEEGLYPLPIDTYESPLFSVLDFVSVTLADGETADKVESSFTLVDEVMGKTITWKSSDDSIIKISGKNAVVTKPEFGYADVTITARADGIMKSYDLRVFSGVLGSITRVGDTLKAVNYPSGVMFKWIVKNAATGATVGTASSKDGTYTLTSKDSNGMVTLQVDGYDDAVYYNSNIPTIYINGNAGYYDISKASYSPMTMQVVTTEEYPDTSYSGSVEVKLRGNSTAYQAKRPFKIKLGEKTDLFGMGENKHWCLLANVYDRTNLRNKLSYDFSMDLGLSGCESMFVNLIYNGDYYGMYQLTEAIRISDGRVEIFNWEEEAEDVAKAIAKKEGLSKTERDALEERMTRDLAWITSGTFENYTISDYVDNSVYDITGGYLIEDDFYFDEITKFMTENDMKLMLKNPEYLVTNSDMMNYLVDYIQDLEDALYSPNRLNSDSKHYSEYMDIPSFIDFWMVNEVFKNVELLYKSCYMYKDVGGGLLTWGPVWDMDWTSGNHVNLFGEGGKYDTWWHSESQDREYWYRALYNDPWFVLQLYDRWGEIQENIDKMMTELDVWNETLATAAAIDNSRWWYDWSNENEVNALRQWLVNRREWMEQQMQTPDTLIESFGYYQKSKNIGITGIYEGSTYYDLYLTINGDTIKSADILINGNIVRSEEVQNGGKIRIEMSELRGAGLYSSVEVLAKDANGSYITVRKRSGQNGASIMDSDYVYLLGK